MLKLEEIFDLNRTKHADLLKDTSYPWEILGSLESYIEAKIKPGNRGEIKGNVYIADNVEIGEGTVVEHGAMIYGPTIIGNNCKIGAGAYIRSGSLIGDNCVVGHASEIKNSWLFDGARAAHFNYIGDSILGADVNLGAGTKITNWRLDGRTVGVKEADGFIDTGLIKFGSLIGDETHTGSNSVLNPGTILGKKCAVYPLKNVGGVFGIGSIIK